MTRPTSDKVPNFNQPPQPLLRRGIPPYMLWLLSIAITLSAAMLTGGLAYLSGSCLLNDTVMELVSSILCVLILFCVFRTRHSQRWVFPLLLLGGGLLFFLTGSLLMPALLLSLLAAIGFSALLLAVSEKQVAVWLAFIPLFAYGLSLALCRDPLLSLVALLPFPAAAALAFGTRAAAEREDAPGRVGIICLTSLALGLCVLGLCALLLGRRLGTLSPAHLSAWLEELRTSMTNTLVEVMQSLSDALSETMGDQAPSGIALTEAQARDIINSLINIFPGLAVAACNIAAALGQVLFHGSLTAFGYGSSVQGRVRLFRMSLMSGIVFLIAWGITLATTLANSDSTMAGTVAQNILLILQPGLILVGLLRLLARLARRAGCLSFLLLFMIPMLLLYASPLLAAYAAIASILDAIFSKVRPPQDNGPTDSL